MTYKGTGRVFRFIRTKLGFHLHRIPRRQWIYTREACRKIWCRKTPSFGLARWCYQNQKGCKCSSQAKQVYNRSAKPFNGPV